MEIRKALRADEPWIKEIYKQEKKRIGSFNLYKSWESYLLGKGSFLVIAGIGFVRYTTTKREGMNTIQEIAISKEFKRRGYGRALLEAVPKPFKLKCDKENEEGNAFYLKMGLEKIGVTTTKNGKPQNIYLCAESLSMWESRSLIN